MIRGAVNRLGATKPGEYRPMKLVKNKPRPVTILEDYNFEWYPDQMDDFTAQWEAGYSLPDIAKTMKRKQVEIALLIIHLELESRIKPRKGGMGGWR